METYHKLHQNETQNEAHKAVKCLKEIGFDLLRIRKALPALTGITHPRVAQILGVSRQSVTSIMNALRGNVRPQSRIAGVYGVPVHEIFDVKCLCAHCQGGDNGDRADEVSVCG